MAKDTPSRQEHPDQADELVKQAVRLVEEAAHLRETSARPKDAPALRALMPIIGRFVRGDQGAAEASTHPARTVDSPNDVDALIISAMEQLEHAAAVAEDEGALLDSRSIRSHLPLLRRNLSTYAPEPPEVTESRTVRHFLYTMPHGSKRVFNVTYGSRTGQGGYDVCKVVFRSPESPMDRYSDDDLPADVETAGREISGEAALRITGWWIEGHRALDDAWQQLSRVPENDNLAEAAKALRLFIANITAAGCVSGPFGS